MGLSYNVYLNSHKIYGCKNCKAHLSNHEDIISRVRPSSSLPCSSPQISGYLPLPHPPPLWPTLPFSFSFSFPFSSFSFFGRPQILTRTLRAELPWPARQSVPLQQRRQRGGGRGLGAQHDDGPAHCARHLLSAVQRDGRLEVRQGLRGEREVQGGQVHPGGGATLQCHLDPGGLLLAKCVQGRRLQGVWIPRAWRLGKGVGWMDGWIHVKEGTGQRDGVAM